ncbi:hypothetical protein ACFE04_008060 [Oxalis oulophora]
MKKRLPQIPEFWVICSRNIGAVFTKSATYLDKKLNKIDGAWIEFERFPPEHMARQELEDDVRGVWSCALDGLTPFEGQPSQLTHTRLNFPKGLPLAERTLRDVENLLIAYLKFEDQQHISILKACTIRLVAPGLSRVRKCNNYALALYRYNREIDFLSSSSS